MVNHLHASLAAFWSTDTDTVWDNVCTGLKQYQADRLSNLVVLNRLDQRPRVTPLREQGLATVLGYVGTRVEEDPPNDDQGPKKGQLKEWRSIKTAIDGWVTGDSATATDGIYLDELVLHQDPDTGERPPNEAQPIVEAFHASYPHLKLMILAGNSPHRWVVDGFTNAAGNHVAPPDWVLLFEGTVKAYREDFSVTEIKPQDREKNTYAATMPSWWKDPTYRHQIAHTVHGTADEADWREITERAAARNVGHLYVMDQRDKDKHGKYTRYDHLPAFFINQCTLADTHNRRIQLSDNEIIYATRKLGLRTLLPGNPPRPALHAWPTFGPREDTGQLAIDVWQVPDTLEWRKEVTVVQIPYVQLTDPEGVRPKPFDVSSMWGAVHRWAADKTMHPAVEYLTAMPTFAPIVNDQVEAVAFAPTKPIPPYGPWLVPVLLPLAPSPRYPSDYRKEAPEPVDQSLVRSRYTFAEPSSVVRYVAETHQGPDTGGLTVTAWPTFNANLSDILDNGDPCGRTTVTGHRGYDIIRVDREPGFPGLERGAYAVADLAAVLRD